MKSNSILPLLMGGILMFTFGCNNSSEKKESEPTLEQQKEQLSSKLTEIRSDLDGRIDELTDKSEELGEEAKLQVSTALTKLKSERDKVTSLLDRVKNASKGSIDALEDEVNDVGEEIVEDINNLSDKSKEWFDDQKKKLENS